MLFWSSKAVLSSETLMLNFIIHALSRITKSGNFKYFYLQKGDRANNWPAVLQCGEHLLNVFDSGLSLAKWQHWRLQRKRGWCCWPFPNRISSACCKIIVPCLPSLLISHRQNTKESGMGTQQTTHVVGFSTVYICQPIPCVSIKTQGRIRKK